jgi:hypothetical protein
MSEHHPLKRRGPQARGGRPLRLRQLLHRAMVVAGLLAGSVAAANAAVQITVDKDAQRMTVAVDGVQRYSWPVSSGLPAHETPNGSFRTFRMEADHYSKEWDDAPMPHSIFFTKQGHAIHGTDSVRNLGRPASHGCVRLSRENAATLYGLVEKEGVLNTTVTLTGSSQVALARGTGSRTAVARGEAVGEPVQLAPRGGQAVTTYEGPSDIYVDQYGRPVTTSRNRGYAAAPADDFFGQRRIYQPRQRTYADDAAGTYDDGRAVYAPRPRTYYYYAQ